MQLNLLEVKFNLFNFFKKNNNFKGYTGYPIMTTGSPFRTYDSCFSVLPPTKTTTATIATKATATTATKATATTASKTVSSPTTSTSINPTINTNSSSSPFIGIYLKNETKLKTNREFKCQWNVASYNYYWSSSRRFE